MDETPQLAKGVANAVYELYEVVTHGLLSPDLRYVIQFPFVFRYFTFSMGNHAFSFSFISEQIDTWNILARARNEGRLFSNVGWPRDPDIVKLLKDFNFI